MNLQCRDLTAKWMGHERQGAQLCALFWILSIQLFYRKCSIHSAAKSYPHCQKCGKCQINGTSCIQCYNGASIEQGTGAY